MMALYCILNSYMYMGWSPLFFFNFICQFLYPSHLTFWLIFGKAYLHLFLFKVVLFVLLFFHKHFRISLMSLL